MKKLINTANVYLALALIGGVFYREFTKFNNFVDKTSLSVVHVHFIVLGVLVFILLAIINKLNKLDEGKLFNRFYLTYNGALVFMNVMFIIRGITQVLGLELSKGANAAISGIAGISHILMMVGLIMLMKVIKQALSK